MREPFNEGRLATVQIERGSGKREITWMQAAIKALLIYCKHTFAALQNCTTHLRTKQKAKHFISNEIIITSLLSLHSIMESA